MELGIPVVIQFRIKAVSLINVIDITIDASNNTDSDFVNIFFLPGLKPNTEYSLTVRALSSLQQLGLLISEPSDAIEFNTTLGGKNYYYNFQIKRLVIIIHYSS